MMPLSYILTLTYLSSRNRDGQKLMDRIAYSVDFLIPVLDLRAGDIRILNSSSTLAIGEWKGQCARRPAARGKTSSRHLRPAPMCARKLVLSSEMGDSLRLLARFPREERFGAASATPARAARR